MCVDMCACISHSYDYYNYWNDCFLCNYAISQNEWQVTCVHVVAICGYSRPHIRFFLHVFVVEAIATVGQHVLVQYTPLFSSCFLGWVFLGFSFIRITQQLIHKNKRRYVSDGNVYAIEINVYACACMHSLESSDRFACAGATTQTNLIYMDCKSDFPIKWAKMKNILNISWSGIDVSRPLNNLQWLQTKNKRTK